MLIKVLLLKEKVSIWVEVLSRNCFEEVLIVEYGSERLNSEKLEINSSVVLNPFSGILEIINSASVREIFGNIEVKK